MPIHVYSEVNSLKKVLVHEPGKELLNLTPDALEDLLFDDIPAFHKAQEEHQNFAQLFRDHGVEVVYLEDLVVESLDIDSKIKEDFLITYLEESYLDASYSDMIRTYLLSMNTKDMVRTTMAGLTRYDLEKAGFSLDRYEKDYLIYPMPNLYFTRDSFATIGSQVSINHMYSRTRNRESLYGDFIFRYHPEYKGTKNLYGRSQEYSIEGGDILIINEDLLLIGDSQRTDQEAIEILAENILSSKQDFKTILQLSIEDKRAFMHLDTVLTQLDEDSFVIYEGILENMEITEWTYRDGSLKGKNLNKPLDQVLGEYMNRDKIHFYPCGGDNPIDAQREQWTDGANVVALSPGKIIAYKRNFVTNRILKEAGYEVLELDASNLTMGRGGPRCMSMPLERY